MLPSIDESLRTDLPRSEVVVNAGRDEEESGEGLEAADYQECG